MHVLQIHNSYQQQGGEDAVVEAEYNLLVNGGHKVTRFIVYNEAINSVKLKIRSALEVGHSPKSFENIKKLLSVHQPDIVHVHNFFPLITPAVFKACTNMEVPVIATLHNYRLVCASATFMRAGKTCELCLNGSSYWGFIHRCYRGSLVGSLATAQMIRHHRRTGTWHKHVTRFIALTQFQKNKLVQANFPSKKIVVKSNFLEVRPKALEEGRRKGALFVGRLSPEKGVNILIEAWKQLDYPLTVIGDGLCMNFLRKEAPKNVVFLGSQSRGSVMAAMQQASFLVMPSLWYEGLPMTLVEAYANDLPVIASRIGALAELVEEGVTGYGFAVGDSVDLVRVVQKILRAPIARGLCKDYFLKHYTASVNLKRLENIYGDAIAAAERREKVHW